MTDDYIRDTILLRLGEVAYETAEANLELDTDLCEALSLDEDDFWAFVMSLGHELGIDIPEADYPNFRTIAGGIAYLKRSAAA